MPAQHRRPSPSTGPRGLALFLVVPLLVLAAVSIGTAVFSERLARSNALAGAEGTAVRMTRYLIAPVLEEALTGVPGRWADLDLRVQNRLADESITTVLIWEEPGDVLYASDPGKVGAILAPAQQVLPSVAGRVVSLVDESPPAEEQGVGGGPLLEVYVPVRIGAHALTVATFFGSEGIDHATALLRGQIIPLAIGGLVVLELIQVPIAVSLFRRVRRQDAGRADLLTRSLTASERERRTIAADVHDGPVQDLAGVAYALAALRPRIPPEDRPALDALGAAVRDAVAWLRQLMVELYPPDPVPTSPIATHEDGAAASRSTVDSAVEVTAVPTPRPETAPGPHSGRRTP